MRPRQHLSILDNPINPVESRAKSCLLISPQVREMSAYCTLGVLESGILSQTTSVTVLSNSTPSTGQGRTTFQFEQQGNEPICRPFANLGSSQGGNVFGPSNGLWTMRSGNWLPVLRIQSGNGIFPDGGSSWSELMQAFVTLGMTKLLTSTIRVEMTGVTLSGGGDVRLASGSLANASRTGDTSVLGEGFVPPSSDNVALGSMNRYTRQTGIPGLRKTLALRVVKHSAGNMTAPTNPYGKRQLLYERTMGYEYGFGMWPGAYGREYGECFCSTEPTSIVYPDGGSGNPRSFYLVSGYSWENIDYAPSQNGAWETYQMFVRSLQIGESATLHVRAKVANGQALLLTIVEAYGAIISDGTSWNLLTKYRTLYVQQCIASVTDLVFSASVRCNSGSYYEQFDRNKDYGWLGALVAISPISPATTAECYVELSLEMDGSEVRCGTKPVTIAECGALGSAQTVTCSVESTAKVLPSSAPNAIPFERFFARYGGTVGGVYHRANEEAFVDGIDEAYATTIA